MKIKSNDANLEQSETVRARDKIVEDFMPLWSKEEDCFKAAIITDPDTKKKTAQTFPRPVPMAQIAYENWLEKVVNVQTGQYHQQRDDQGSPIKGTGAKYVIKVITRIKVGKNEFLCSKGRLEGFSASGEPVGRFISYPERWTKTSMKFTRIINEKTMSFDTLCEGPSGTEDVYEVPFSPEAVDKMMESVENDNVTFIVKDDKTGDAVKVEWSSIKESLKLFKESKFESLILGEYIPLPVRQELRAKAEQQGLIPKTYPPTTTASTKTEYLA